MCQRSGTGMASQRGVTIIELLVAMLSAAVLAITASIILVYCFKTLRSNADVVGLQRDVDITTRTLYRAIRTARGNSTTVSPDGKTLTLDAGLRAFTFIQNDAEPSEGTLVYDPDTGVSGDEQTLANHTFHNDCGFWDNTDSVRMLLTLVAEDDRIQVDTDIHMRNEL